MMRSMILLIFTSVWLPSLTLLAQSHTHTDRCAFDAHRQHQLALDPGLAQVWARIEAHTLRTSQSIGTRSGTNVLRIPVVVHVVYNSASQNLSSALVQSQIQVLNEDYRRMNADAVNTLPQFAGVAADTEIEFCLATVDPQGQSTTGITRTQTTVTTFDPFFDNIKVSAQGGRDGWPPSDYLNIWTGPLFQGLLGYATPPGGPLNIDGVVVAWGVFGRPALAAPPGNNAGRVCTHEVGHYLNLFHVFGPGSPCGSDQVADTPTQGAPSMGCPSSPLNSCGSPDMFQNYMDYTDGTCMNLFTQGQRTRMRATLMPGGPRASLLISPAACPQGPSGTLYQVNSFSAGLSINATLGTPTAAAVTNGISGTPVTLFLNSFNTGQSWDLALGTAALIPGGSLTASDGQLVNLDLTDPTLSLFFNLLASPPFTNSTITFTPAGTLSASAQMIVVSPGNASGIALSQPVRLLVP